MNGTVRDEKDDDEEDRAEPENDFLQTGLHLGAIMGFAGGAVNGGAKGRLAVPGGPDMIKWDGEAP